VARTDDIAAHALDARLDAYERKIIRNYREALAKIRADIGKIYERYSVNGKLTHAEMSKYNRLAYLEKQIREDIFPAFKRNAAVYAKVPAMEYDAAFYRYAWSIDQQLGVSLKWGLLNPEAVKAAVANPLDKIAVTRLRANGIARVQSAVAQGLIRGESYPNMMKGIRSAINGTAKDAIRIVRTEGQRAQVLGQEANYSDAREKGVEVVDVWDATLDSRTRPDHGSLDGQKAHYKSGHAYFNTAVGEIKGPLQSGYAAFDIHCRCRVRGEIEGFEPEKRRINGEITEYETFQEWDAKRKAGRQ